MQDHFRTDISWDEMITLAQIADKTPRDRLVTHVLNNDPFQPGGFVVTPDRSLYGGAFVLVPYLNLTTDKFAQIRAFVEVIFRHRRVAGIDPLPIEILNGTRTSGLAGSLQTKLERYGWKISSIDNAPEYVAETMVEFSDTPVHRAAAELLQRFMNISLVPLEPTIIAAEPASITAEDETATPAQTIQNNEIQSAEPTIAQDAPGQIDNRNVFRITIGTDYEEPFRIPTFPKDEL